MEEQTCPNHTFHIYGSNVQILPNATKAELHFHGNNCETTELQLIISVSTPITQQQSTEKTLEHFVHPILEIQVLYNKRPSII